MILFRIITLFPDFFDSPLRSGLLGKAINSEIIKVEIINLRDYSKERLNKCDDYSYGGGSGMVLMPGPLFSAIENNRTSKTVVMYPNPGGAVLNQKMVETLAREGDFCIICGHYEGIDQRVIDRYVDCEVSIGDYVLSGGEFAALVIIDAVSRYVPGFMSNADSLREESFENGLLEYPQYTRPSVIDGYEVPDMLLSGDHGKIDQWRLEKSIEKTRKVRPDLYERYIFNRSKGEEK